MGEQVVHPCDREAHRWSYENGVCKVCNPNRKTFRHRGFRPVAPQSNSEIANLERAVVEAAVKANPELRSHWLRHDSRAAAELVGAVDALIAQREKVEDDSSQPK